MIRVLQMVTKMDRAGLETILMNACRKFSHAQVHFGFLAQRDAEDCCYDKKRKCFLRKILSVLIIGFSVSLFFCGIAVANSIFEQHHQFRQETDEIDASRIRVPIQIKPFRHLNEAYVAMRARS